MLLLQQIHCVQVFRCWLWDKEMQHNNSLTGKQSMTNTSSKQKKGDNGNCKSKQRHKCNMTRKISITYITFFLVCFLKEWKEQWKKWNERVRDKTIEREKEPKILAWCWQKLLRTIIIMIVDRYGELSWTIVCDLQSVREWENERQSANQSGVPFFC